MPPENKNLATTARLREQKRKLMRRNRTRERKKKLFPETQQKTFS
jgi:hypothetical protein